MHVKREDDGTRLSVLQSRVAARPQSSADETLYNEGQQVLMHRDGLGQMFAVTPAADAWTHGMLVLDNVRLADMVRELNRYKRGHLGVDDDVADLRITGSFPLNNINGADAAACPQNADTLFIRVNLNEWVGGTPRSGRGEAVDREGSTLRTPRYPILITT